MYFVCMQNSFVNVRAKWIVLFYSRLIAINPDFNPQLGPTYDGTTQLGKMIPVEWWVWLARGCRLLGWLLAFMFGFLSKISSHFSFQLQHLETHKQQRQILDLINIKLCIVTTSFEY
ncbi:hypothetical protein Tsp_03404 [Trichinella spiralis]|nr:hypothetical protein Tsp_03404 [Trichinella spiralis]